MIISMLSKKWIENEICTLPQGQHQHTTTKMRTKHAYMAMAVLSKS